MLLSLHEERLMNEQAYRDGCVSGNDLCGVRDARGDLVMEAILETKADTILSLFTGYAAVW